MTRTQNLQAMAALNVQAYQATTPEAAKKIHALYYVHQIVEAMLTENIDSIPTAHGVAPWN